MATIRLKKSIDSYINRIIKKYETKIKKIHRKVGELVLKEMSKKAPTSFKSTILAMKPIARERGGLRIGKGSSGMQLLIEISPRTKKQRIVFWVDRGTGIYGPHETPIVPRTKKVLKFVVADGTTVYSKWSEGQEGKEFLRKAVNAVKPKIVKLYKDFVKR